MSSRTVLRPYSVITAGDMSAASIISTPTVLQSISEISYAANWAGTAPVGTLAVQGSNDYSLDPNGQTNNAGTWTTLSLSYNGSVVTSVPVSGATGNVVIELKTALYALRLVYTKTSGTGSLNAVVAGKIS